ncbi:MAG: circularly permuted type 2 ATP-grasp protein [Rhodospirillum sp.]|nr:circularly permuted type 2 ATP-grasp protein [Rhodospirillum sp.]
MTSPPTVDPREYLPGLAPPPYMAPPGYDELLSPEGVPRPRWRPFMDMLNALPNGEMERRWDRGERLIRDSGMTYTIYGDPDGHGRPWSLDPIPLLVDAQEWRFIERALIQRATLFNAILAVLYGPRHLLNEGQIPPALVHANPGFLRPMHGAKPKDGTFLHFYAADLARSPDGQWWVVNDRTEAPSGAGYALENRLIISRILPDFTRAINIRRLAPFFMELRESLTKLAPRPIDNPRVVVWTPGPYNETHYEHVYLARYLGLTLVEGEDMTSRDGRIYLKTLEGLKQIDVIIRRNDGAFCDPLELRGDSTLGVPGLVEAVHAGNVTLANALGSRLVEAPAFMPFMPALCRRLLGANLVMPSVATWWCGQEREAAYVLDNLDRLALRPAFQANAGFTQGALLSQKGRAKLRDSIRARPWTFVGQEDVPLSSAPVWVDGQIQPRSMLLRVHVAAREGGYMVMPGGLTRVASDSMSEPGRVSMQLGGGSKDTWVLSETPVEPISLIRAGQEIPCRGSRDLPSRVADNTYWLGRNAERSEDTARLLRKALVLATENGYGGPELRLVLSVFALLGHVDIDLNFAQPEVQESVLRELLVLNANPEGVFGLSSALNSLRRTATAVRDRLSGDTWRAISLLTNEPLSIPPADIPLDLEAQRSQVDGLIMTLLALDGLALENMTHGLGWRFLDIGRRMERAFHTLDLLTGLLMVEDRDIGPGLDVILDISDSSMTYRSRYLSLPTLAPALDILIRDESNPRSLAYQLVRLREHMDKLGTDPSFSPPSEEQRLIAPLAARVTALDPTRVTLGEASNEMEALSNLLSDLRLGLGDLTHALTLHFFAHALETRPDLAGHPDLEVAKAAQDADRRPEMLSAEPEDEEKEATHEERLAAESNLVEMGPGQATPSDSRPPPPEKANSVKADPASPPTQAKASATAMASPPSGDRIP